MKSPDHYTEAERLLDIVEEFSPDDAAWAQATAAAANAHALLAVVDSQVTKVMYR